MKRHRGVDWIIKSILDGKRAYRAFACRSELIIRPNDIMVPRS